MIHICARDYLLERLRQVDLSDEEIEELMYKLNNCFHECCCTEEVPIQKESQLRTCKLFK